MLSLKLSNIAKVNHKIAKSILGFVKKISADKKLIIVSNNKIYNISLSRSTQGILTIVAIFIINLMYQSSQYNGIINDKKIKIAKLEKVNNKFNNEITSINGNLKKINEYFITSANYEDEIDAKNQDGIHSKKFNKIFADLNLKENYKKTAIEIASANTILDNIRGLAKKRISNLEKQMVSTGITINEKRVINNNNLYDNELIALSLNTEEELLRQGGPLEEEAKSNNPQNINESINIGTVDINDEISHLSNLEKFIYHAPLGKPMKNYYVSSSFGKRIDPIRKIMAKHNGMDFVGREFAEIISPSVGEVKRAGNFGAYGKTVIIDHGYGITTRYGHLHSIKVKRGDIVKKGQVIATQGNSGRSTGAHLHYEVRYNQSPLNPKNFLRAGNNIFKKEEI